MCDKWPSVKSRAANRFSTPSRKLYATSWSSTGSGIALLEEEDEQEEEEESDLLWVMAVQMDWGEGGVVVPEEAGEVVAEETGNVVLPEEKEEQAVFRVQVMEEALVREKDPEPACLPGEVFLQFPKAPLVPDTRQTQSRWKTEPGTVPEERPLNPLLTATTRASIASPPYHQRNMRLHLAPTSRSKCHRPSPPPAPSHQEPI